MTYDINVREVDTIKAMTVRFVSSGETICGDMSAFFGELYGYLESNGAMFTGECFAIYHDEEFSPEHIDIECGFSVADLLPDEDPVMGRKIEGGLMACTLHPGSYEKLEEAYDAIKAWAEENGYLIQSKVRELYIDGPKSEGVDSPEDYLTEVLWPIRKIEEEGVEEGADQLDNT